VITTPAAALDLESVYLTAEQVAAMLQLSSKTIYRLVKSDATMPALRLGGTVRFPRERLEQWLRDREQGRARTRKPMLAVAKPASGQEPAGA
jgi:excisionase family DNA binding protein